MKLISLFAITIVLAVGLSCKLGSLAGGGDHGYTSSTDKFSVNFPGGSGGVASESSKGLKATGPGVTYEKAFDNRSENYRSYEVTAYSLTASKDRNQRDILLIGLNGWDDEPGTIVKDTSINGQKALDSVRTIEIGPVKMTFREVVIWSDKEQKLYVIQVAASKKENVATGEANDFVNSFKLTS